MADPGSSDFVTLSVENHTPKDSLLNYGTRAFRKGDARGDSRHLLLITDIIK